MCSNNGDSAFTKGSGHAFVTLSRITNDSAKPIDETIKPNTKRSAFSADRWLDKIVGIKENCDDAN